MSDTRFRPDIQGLRAVAVAMVVIYHLYPFLLPGGFAGVDVFFVISGYLITGHLWRGYRDTGRVCLVDFWGRRARRLVPAAALVLAVTWTGARLLIPATRLADTAQEILASALYFQNWQLARNAVDYLKAGQVASPVQHFWSLSVEEQFYLVWPLLFLLAALVPRFLPGAARRPRARGTVVAIATTALVIGSLAYSVRDTEHDAAAAYFVTTTRMWELGIGGLLALGFASRRVTRPLRWLRFPLWRGWLGWAGLGSVIWSAFVLNGTMAFPGYIALLPVLGSAALIAGGTSLPAGSLPRGPLPGRGLLSGPARVMSAPPMVFLGGISYSLYLWHFPVISLFTAWHGRGPGLAAGPPLLAVCVLLAWLTKSYVEDPVRLASWLRGHGWRSVSTALAAAVPVTLVAVYIAAEPPPWNGRLGPGYPGAAVLADRLTGATDKVPDKPVLPPPAQVSEPDYWVHGCLADEYATTPTQCVFGDTRHPKLTVALVGDSVAGNWWAALRVIAAQEHWKLVTDLHATCAWSATPAVAPGKGGPYPACTTWGARVLGDLKTKIRPQLVITSSMATERAAGYPGGGVPSQAALGAGETAYWKQLQASGIRVVAIRETPELGINAPSCVWQYGTTSPRCAVPRSRAITPDPPSSFAARATGAPVVDMDDLICGPDACRPAVGNVLVYFDSHHITQAYSQTLAPYLKARLLATGAVPEERSPSARG